MGIGVSVAIQAPSHGKRLFLLDSLHIGDIAMAAGASNPGPEMGAVVKIDKIRRLMNPDPLNCNAA